MKKRLKANIDPNYLAKLRYFGTSTVELEEIAPPEPINEYIDEFGRKITVYKPAKAHGVADDSQKRMPGVASS